jgi:hypothetical protein
MKQIAVILGILLLVFLIVLAIFVHDEPDNSTGFDHPKLTEVRIGGDGLSRFEPIALAAFLFHTASLILVSAFILLSIAPRYRSGLLWISIGLVSAVCIWE